VQTANSGGSGLLIFVPRTAHSVEFRKRLGRNIAPKIITAAHLHSDEVSETTTIRSPLALMVK
jgi:hypothetical protein